MPDIHRRLVLYIREVEKAAIKIYHIERNALLDPSWDDLSPLRRHQYMLRAKAERVSKPRGVIA